MFGLGLYDILFDIKLLRNYLFIVGNVLLTCLEIREVSFSLLDFSYGTKCITVVSNTYYNIKHIQNLIKQFLFYIFNNECHIING